MVSLIAAMSNNRVIGVHNDLPWHLPKDLAYFESKTQGHPVIMGSRTFDSLPPSQKPLPGRKNIVLSRDGAKAYRGAVVTSTIEEALKIAQEENDPEVFVVGGGQVFAQALPFADRIYLTIVDTEIENGEAFFPKFDESEWNRTEVGHFEKDEKHKYRGTFYCYDRK